jgi:hypothetical protein
MTRSTHQQLICVLEEAGTDSAVRRLIRALGRQPALQLEELEELIAGLGGPEVAARVVVEVYRGGQGA